MLPSHQVTLGVLEKNENETSDMIDIKHHMHTFVPAHISKEKTSLQPILCFGDLLTVERGLHAQEDRRNSRDPSSRFEGLIDVLADFHTFGNFLEVNQFEITVITIMTTVTRSWNNSFFLHTQLCPLQVKIRHIFHVQLFDSLNLKLNNQNLIFCSLY